MTGNPVFHVSSDARRCVLDMLYHVIMQLLGGYIAMDAINFRNWRMATLLDGITLSMGLDILQHSL